MRQRVGRRVDERVDKPLHAEVGRLQRDPHWEHLLLPVQALPARPSAGARAARQHRRSRGSSARSRHQSQHAHLLRTDRNRRAGRRRYAVRSRRAFEE